MRDSGPKFNIVAVEIYDSCTLSRRKVQGKPLVKMCKICCDEILLLNFHKGRIDIMCAPTINLAVRAQKAHREEERRYGVFIIISAMPRHGWSKKWVLMSLFWTLRRRGVKNKHRKWPPRHLLYISSHDSFFIYTYVYTWVRCWENNASWNFVFLFYVMATNRRHTHRSACTPQRRSKIRQSTA